jgi:hypothetical protein
MTICSEEQKNDASFPLSGKTEDVAAFFPSVPYILLPSSCSWGSGMSRFDHEMHGRSLYIDWMPAFSICLVLSSALLIFWVFA